MNRRNALLLLLVLLLFIPDAETTKFTDCSPTPLPCVSGMSRELTISYPFRTPDMPEYCGHPEFEISCPNNVSTIVIAKKEYQVQNIIYDTRFLGVSDVAYSGDVCPQTFSNTTIDLLFNYSSNSINLTMYFDCFDISDASILENIPCLENNSHVGYRSYYRIPDDVDDASVVLVDMLLKKCSSVVLIPIYGDDAVPLEKGRVDFLGVLQDGFGLNWAVGEDWCGGCQDSGGVCGFDRTSPEARTCFCRDGGIADGTCHGDGGSRKKKAIAIAASVGGTVILIAILCCIAILYKRRKRLKRSGVSNLLSHSTSSQLSSKKDAELGESSYHTHIFSYEELQEATNGFDSSRELGDGGFGTVYKGTLRDGRTVAVKRLYENNYRRLEQFMNEVAILSRLRHQNLVTLYGCTSRHSRELLLVYEFVPNGTIADHLHGTIASAGPLPWNVRMTIAIETAYALAYLHAVEPQIIHRDVKSNNILLDNNFHVKVADFGLSRLFPLHVTHVSTAPQGTPGYVDPEYHQCYQLTDKSDVYSFGVVLVELISSKPAVDISRSRHEINLANMAVSRIQNRQLDQLVDPLLGYQSDTEVTRMITQVAELAFTCLQSDRDLRPSIKEALEVLKAIHNVGYEAEKSEAAEAQVREETKLLKNAASPFSPDSVTDKWQSSLTTPNNSG